MTFAQRRNRLTTHFSESIPVFKRSTYVLTGPVACKVNTESVTLEWVFTVGTDNRKPKLWEKILSQCYWDHNRFCMGYPAWDRIRSSAVSDHRL